ncbi:molybdenum-binding protein [Anoxybacter fermentans]|uniref:Molybdenum-binding protein n=1 Tax=Anoxybacter fermentans TaxID=1323375 RepID=A0A3Q9HNT4_9FIRM|nr:LysR family transcriptional regulator [Anoxybacter fermentans]AZR72109.1 molybdenum-binding protein [Anoxybacter fermentans]
MELKFKIWLEEDGEKLFGIGPCDILKRVKRTGSLRRAAAEINMSYSQAWKLIDRLENALGFSLLEKQVGGKTGGGSRLTPEGKMLMDAYENFYQEASEILEKLCDKWFTPFFKKQK